MIAPREIKWEIEKPLGRGGQGATFLVRSKTDPGQVGVLKLQLQERKNDAKSRQRMHQEVSNLQIAGSTAAKVPQVLDSNTHLYAGADDLYFVMELIEGESLEDLMKREKSLSIDDAFDLAIDLSKTLKFCHEKSIMHRDLKPANILIRGRKPMDAVIVDYGLSFNEQEIQQNDLTSGGEPIGNSFTDLPERRTPDAQRHYESDMTAVMGILYYCMTGQRPTPFRDAFGAAPHRRKGELSLREAMRGHPATARLELVFDRAFEQIISDRFSSAAELVERLLHAQAGTAAKDAKSLDDVLKVASAEIVKSSRTMQLHKYREAVEKVIRTCENELGKARPANNFQLSVMRPPSNVQFTVPADMSFLEKAFALGVSVVNVGEASVVEYAFAARGNQTAILRRRMTVTAASPSQPHTRQNPFEGGGGFGGGGFFGMQAGEVDQNNAYLVQLVRKPVKPAGDWEVRLWYPGDGQPNHDELMDELTDSVAMLIEELKERLN